MNKFGVILLLVCFILQGKGQGSDVHGDEEMPPLPDPFGYLVVTPKALFGGKEESMCVTIKDSEEPVEVTFVFMEKNLTEIARSPPFIVEFDTTCSKVQIPYVEEDMYPETVVLSVRMKRLSADETELRKDRKVVIFKTGTETFVQTDKPIYKPGQPVKLRVLTLGRDLKPDLSAVSDILVETPSGIRVAQWLDQSSADGLLDLEVPMSSDPPLGEWKVIVIRGDERIEKTFKVDEYVLPKFEVMITTPEFILTNAEEFEIRICARYTYGQPVRGSFSADVSIEEAYRSSYGRDQPRPVLRFESADTGMSGCGTVVVTGAAMRLNSSDFSVWSSQLKVNVNFTEEVTGVTLSEDFESKRGIVITDPLVMSFEGPSTFKPGMPYNAWLTVKHPDGRPAAGEEITVIARADWAEVYNQTLTSPDDGIIHVLLENIDIQTENLDVFAQAKGYSNVKPYDPEDETVFDYHYIYDPIASLYVEASYSPSGSFVQIAPMDGPLVPGTEQEILTHFTADPATVDDLQWFYVFKARNEILTVPVSPVESSPTRKRRTSEPIFPEDIFPPFPEEEKVNITEPGQLLSKRNKFTVTPAMAPRAYLLVYYIRPDQEVVAHSLQLDVEPDFDNKVSIGFASKEEAPGGKATLKLSASEGSLCAVGIVDKSVYVLEEDKDKLTKAKVFDKMKEDQQYYNSYWTPSESDHCPDEYPWWWYGAVDRRRRSILPYDSSSYEDSSKAFEDIGLVFISNMKVETRPCNSGSYPVLYNEELPVASESSIDLGGAPGLARAESVRSFFPETWLWKLVRIGGAGEAEEDLDVPHSITDWISNGLCVSPETGLGVADPSTLRAFQPFFVSLTLPYSMIRGEEVPIKATVFNYLSDECIVVRVSLIESDKFEIVDNTVSHKECICAQASKSFDFLVSSLVLGELDVEVHVVSVADEEFLCGNEVDVSGNLGVSDAVRRKILVEPEGIQHEYSINKYFCPSDSPFYSYNKRFPLPTPPNIVEGSMRGKMTLTGDMMGQTINNLDSLLQIPMGCGEQNMVGFVPNIVVMQYLTSSGTLTDDLKAQAESNMKQGYMRELNYRHKDGSYSAFGESDDSGSTWLTAYVVRAYAQASEFIKIDQEDLDVSIDWLKKRQNDRGCFNAVGNLCHKAMAGGVNNEATLTAYVVTSMLEAGVLAEDAIIQKAFECLDKEAQTLTDTYAAAQLAYAYVLAGHPGTQDVMDLLESQAVKDGQTKHWVSNRDDVADYDSYYRSSKLSQEIEMTSYALLAYTEFKSPSDARIEGRPVVRWLLRQRSSNGGFSSTQDTVVGLQALAAYASRLNRGPTKMRVEVLEGGRKVRQFELSERNKLLMQLMDLNVPSIYSLRARGKGCGLVQFTVFYNKLPQTPPVAPFALTKSSMNLGNKCDRYNTQLCASYTGTGGSNMVLAQVKLMTGFVPDMSSVNDLKAQAPMSKLKRIEPEGNTINFYIDQGLDSTPVCWDLIATKEFDVKNAKPGTVTMYDYYEKDLAISDSLEFLCEEAEEPEPVDQESVPSIKPAVEPEVDATEKPIEPEVDATEGPVEPEVDATEKPVMPEVEATEGPVMPEVDATEGPVMPEVDATEGPVEPEVDATEKPVMPEVEATEGPVMPEVDATEEPVEPEVDAMEEPVEPEVDATEKPVKPEVDATEKPEKPPVDEVDPEAKPEKPPVVPEVDTDAKPEKPPVIPEVDATDKPVVPEVDATEKPVKPEVEVTEKPVVPEVDVSEKTEKPPVDQVDTDAKPEVDATEGPVMPEVDATDKPVMPEVDSTEGPVMPEVDATEKPVMPEVDATEKPVMPEVDATEGPVMPEVDATEGPVMPEVDSTEGPVMPEVDATEGPVIPEVDATEGAVMPEVDASGKPVMPEVDATEGPVMPEVDATEGPVMPEVDATEKPVMPEVDATEGPVMPEVDATEGPVMPEVDATEGPVMPEVDVTEGPVMPEVDVTEGPVMPEVDATEKPVMPEVDVSEKTEKPPVDQIDTDAKPEKPSVVPEVDATEGPVMPEVDATEGPVMPEVDATEGPVMPEVDATEGPVMPEVDATEGPVMPEVYATEGPVMPEVDATEKPVMPEVDVSEKTEKPPVDQIDTDAKPEKPSVVPEVDATEGPVMPEVDATEGPVMPEVDATEGPVMPEVDATEGPVMPEVYATKGPVMPEVDATEGPVMPEVDVTEGPVMPEVDATEGPVMPEVDVTEGPVMPEVDATEGPVMPKLDATEGPVMPEVDATEKPVMPEVDATEGPVMPEVDSTEGPVMPEVDATEGSVMPEVDATEGPVMPEVDASEKPVMPEVDATEGPVMPEVDVTEGPVMPEVDATEGPVMPEVDATEGPVMPEVDATEKPVMPEMDVSEKTEKPPVDQIDTDAKPEKPSVLPEVDATEKPVLPEVDATEGPVMPEVDATEGPVMPEVDATEGPVMPEVDATEGPVMPEVDATEGPVMPEVDATEGPVMPEVDVTEGPVMPEVDATEGPVMPEVDATEKPVMPLVDATEEPVKPEVDVTEEPVVPEVDVTEEPVMPEVDVTEKPVEPDVDRTVPTTTAPTTTVTPTTPMLIYDTFCMLYPDICGNGECVDDESQPSFHRCDCDAGFVDQNGMCTAITTVPPVPTTGDTVCMLEPDVCGQGVCVHDETRALYYRCDCDWGYMEEQGVCMEQTTVPTPTTVPIPTSVPVIADTVCMLEPDVCGQGVCVHDETRALYYRCDCDSGYVEDEGVCVDVNECDFENVCLNPNTACVNLPGTYECNCLEGFQDIDGNCVSCPVCSSDLSDGFEDQFCTSDYVYGVKIRSDGMLRILVELRQEENKIGATRYMDPVVDPRCKCDQLKYGDRILIMTDMSKVSIEQLKRRTVETVDLGGAIIVPLKTSNKNRLGIARSTKCN